MNTILGTNVVALFFYDGKEFLTAGCSIEDAEKYGQFRNYPESHFDVWEKHFEASHNGKEYDYYPRGRVIYRVTDGAYLIYCDKCIKEIVRRQILPMYPRDKVLLLHDYHYQCYKCNMNYVQLDDDF